MDINGQDDDNKKDLFQQFSDKVIFASQTCLSHKNILWLLSLIMVPFIKNVFKNPPI